MTLLIKQNNIDLTVKLNCHWGLKKDLQGCAGLERIKSTHMGFYHKAAFVPFAPQSGLISKHFNPPL